MRPTDPANDMHSPGGNPSFLKAASPYTNELRQAQQTWHALATTPFRDLTADSTLRTLVGSAGLAQRSQVDEISLYLILFCAERVLIVPKIDAFGAIVEGTWTIPHDNIFASKEVDGTRTIRDTVVAYCSDGLGLTCDSGSAYLMKAILSDVKGPMVAAIVRLQLPESHGECNERITTGNWLTLSDVQEFEELKMQPVGLKDLIIEAYEQKQFEEDVLKV